MYCDYSDFCTKIYISQGSVTTQLIKKWWSVTTLLQNFHRMCRWIFFENLSKFGDDIDRSLWLTFVGPPCISDMTMSVCLSVGRQLWASVCLVSSHCTRGATADCVSIDGWWPTCTDCGLSIRGRWSADIVLICGHRPAYTWEICTKTLRTMTQQSTANDGSLTSRSIGAIYLFHNDLPL